MNKSDRIPVWEWVLAGVGAVILVGAIAFFTTQAINPSGIPQLTAEVDSVVPVAGRYIVAFTVRNEGETASNVTVDGTLTEGESVLARATVSLPFVPANSQNSAAMMFDYDPRSHRLRVVVTSFTQP